MFSFSDAVQLAAHFSLLFLFCRCFARFPPYFPMSLLFCAFPRTVLQRFRNAVTRKRRRFHRNIKKKEKNSRSLYSSETGERQQRGRAALFSGFAVCVAVLDPRAAVVSWPHLLSFLFDCSSLVLVSVYRARFSLSLSCTQTGKQASGQHPVPPFIQPQGPFRLLSPPLRLFCSVIFLYRTSSFFFSC